MTRRVLFVFEFAPADDEMARTLLAALQQRRPDWQVVAAHGWFPGYQPGGLRPRRLANFLWIYLQVPFRLLFGRVDAVIVRSTPPGIQLWTLGWAKLRQIPVICWLMDYHPEIEARSLARRGHLRLAAGLRWLDGALLPGFAQVVVLDRAMARLARARAPGVEVVEHPTWAAAAAQAARLVAYRPGSGKDALHLAYSGNLGHAHDLAPLAALLREVLPHRAVALFVIGSSPAGEERFRRLGMELGVPVTLHPRVPFAALPARYEEWRIDAGLVLLAEESAGLVAPSKFSGYVHFGLPLAYLGPPDTSTADVCERFRGGFWLPAGASAAQVRTVAAALLDPAAMETASAGAVAASAHFAAFSGDTLAERMVRHLPGPARPARPVVVAADQSHAGP